MTGNQWAQRVRGRAPLPELQEVRDAARDISQQAGKFPGETGLVMQKVTQVLLLSTAGIGATLALIHLCKALANHSSSRHSDRRDEPQDARSRVAASHGHNHDAGSHGR